MSLLLVFFSVSIVVSFLCSLWEATLLTIPPSYVETQAQEETEFGKRLKTYKTDVDRPLSAILTLNTIAHTVGAIGVGAQATRIWPGNELVTGLVVPVVMTLAILILSEIIPKTLGATRWKSMSGFTVSSLHIIQIALLPLVWLSEQITKGLKGAHGAVTVTRTDMLALASLSQREGVLDAGEGKLMTNLLTFREVIAEAVMTPRTVLHAAPRTRTIAEYIEEHQNLPYSRIPLFGRSRDDIQGYVLKDDLLLTAFRQNANVEMSTIQRPLLSVLENEPISRVLDKLLAAREHIARVVDEFGGTAGIITQEDIFETLLGLEILDETDATADLQEHARSLNRQRMRTAARQVSPAESAEPNSSLSSNLDSVAQQINDVVDKSTPSLGLTGEQVPIDDSGDQVVAR